MTAHPVTLIPGDALGPEVTAAAVRVLEATGVRIEWDVREAGAAAVERHGTPLPEATLASILDRGVVLKGPTSTPAGGGFRSVNLTLREELDLHTGVRPCRALPGVPTRAPETDLVVVRMNHEDVYAGIEFPAGGAGNDRVRAAIAASGGAAIPPSGGITVKSLTAAAVKRTARAAFTYAHTWKRRRVTAVHKATVMPATDGLFLEAAREVAGEFDDVAFDDRLVDTLCHDLVARPGKDDVLLLPVLYGDIVSDLGAGLAGGLGMVPGMNLGDRCAMFEAVHGSAPRLAGRDLANPMAMMLAGGMLLRHLGEAQAGDRVEAAVAAIVCEGRTVTYDLRPGRDPVSASGTRAVAEAVATALEGAADGPGEPPGDAPR